MCTVYPLRSRYAYWLLFYLRKVPNMSKLMCPKPEKKNIPGEMFDLRSAWVNFYRKGIASLGHPKSTTRLNHAWSVGYACLQHVERVKLSARIGMHEALYRTFTGMLSLIRTFTNISTAKCSKYKHIYQAYISLIHAGWNIYIFKIYRCLNLRERYIHSYSA